MKEKIKIMGYGILVIYGIGVMISGTYFEWLYAVEHGFLNWLLFGWIVPVFKALIWPIYLFL